MTPQEQMAQYVGKSFADRVEESVVRLLQINGGDFRRAENTARAWSISGGAYWVSVADSLREMRWAAARHRTG